MGTYSDNLKHRTKKGKVAQPEEPQKTTLANEVFEMVEDEQEASKWEDLDQIFVTQAEGIIRIAEAINDVSTYPEFKEYMEDKPEAYITLKGFTKDINTLTTDLAGIKALHNNRSGPIKSEQDLVDSLNIFDNYVNFQNRFGTCVEPVINILTDIGLEKELDKVDITKSETPTETPTDETKE